MDRGIDELETEKALLRQWEQTGKWMVDHACHLDEGSDLSYSNPTV